MSTEQVIMIAMTKIMVNQLATLQDTYYEQLVKMLEIDDKGLWMFDYLFNCEQTKTFDDYLKEYGVNYESLSD